VSIEQSKVHLIDPASPLILLQFVYHKDVAVLGLDVFSHDWSHGSWNGPFGGVAQWQ